MIITRSPLRISLGGGGTDLPSYYQSNGGYVLAGAINRYVYVTVTRPFTPGVILKYSQVESVFLVEEIKHPIFREALLMLNLRTPQIEVSTIADISAGTGLGSSGSFTTALIKALFAHRKKSIGARDLAELACEIELEKLHEPIGKQDQYIAAFGGITEFIFNPDGSVEANPLPISPDTMFDLEDNLLLFFTGISRSASQILLDQDKKSRINDSQMLDNLNFIKDVGLRSKSALESGNTETFGKLMHEHWEHKRVRSDGMSTGQIDSWYKLARDNGATGGKLVGAGGGGFLMFYAHDRNRLRHVMREAGLEEMRFGFDFEGTKVILS